MSETRTYLVRYYAGTYTGVRKVVAPDPESAIAVVKAWVRREMTIPMYSDSYRIVEP